MIRVAGIALLLLVPAAGLAQSPPSQLRVPSVLEKGGSENSPAKSGNQTGEDQRSGTEQRPFVVKTIRARETQDEASRDATYQEQRSADQHVLYIGIAAIVFGAAQTAALFFTFWIMRKTAIRQLRAYVFVKSATLSRNPDGTGPWAVHLILKNFGATPADKLVVKLERDTKAAIARDALLPLSANAVTQGPQSIAPGHFVTIRAPLLANNFNFAGSRAAGNKAYVWGRVDYIDAFKRKRAITIQMVHDLDDIEPFAFCEVGNDLS